MSNFKRESKLNIRLSKGIQKSGRLGRITHFEYVNRAGDKVNPKTGKPINRPNISTKENIIKKKKRPLPIKKTGAMFDGLDPIPTNPTVDPPPRTCYNCWQPGHSRRDCPRPVTAIFCNNCGRRGEDLNSCPRCKRAHKEYLLKVQADEGLADLNDEQDQLFPYEDLETDVDGCDEVLNELIYQDERAREMIALERQSENYDLPVTYPRSVTHGRRYDSEREAFPLFEQDRREDSHISRYPHTCVQRERDEDIYGKNERSFVVLDRKKGRSITSFERERADRDTDIEDYEMNRERDIPIIFERKGEVEAPLVDRRDRAREIPPLMEPRSKAVDKEYSMYDRIDREKEREREHNFNYEERNHRSSSLTDRLDSELRNADTNSATDDGDPVHEVLLLAKSISHLSSETQDLIMRQVMAERKEKARQRLSNGRNDAVW